MAHNEQGRRVTGDQLPKSFSVPMGGTIEVSAEDRLEFDKIKAEREAEQKLKMEETRKALELRASQKVTRKLVPWGTRLLVKRRKVEEKSAYILLPDATKDLPTDIADVIEVPEQTMVDVALLRNAQGIVDQLSAKANQGDAASVEALFKFKEYLLIMTTKPGDTILMSRYGGTDFLIQETNQNLCVCDHNGIYARVVEKRA